MLAKLEDASRDLQRRADELAILKTKNDDLRTQLEHATQVANEAAIDFEKKRMILNSEIDELQLQLRTTDSDAFERLNDLNTHIEELLHEKAIVEANLDESKLEIARLKEQHAQKVNIFALTSSLMHSGSRIWYPFQVHASTR